MDAPSTCSTCETWSGKVAKWSILYETPGDWETTESGRGLSNISLCLKARTSGCTIVLLYSTCLFCLLPPPPLPSNCLLGHCGFMSPVLFCISTDCFKYILGIWSKNSKVDIKWTKSICHSKHWTDLNWTHTYIRRQLRSSSHTRMARWYPKWVTLNTCWFLRSCFIKIFHNQNQEGLLMYCLGFVYHLCWIVILW